MTLESAESRVRELDLNDCESLSERTFKFKSDIIVAKKEELKDEDLPPLSMKSEFDPSLSASSNCLCEPSILVVDDIGFNIMAVKVMIEESFNMGVTEALDGHIAVDLFKAGLDKPCKCPNRAFKLIFMDMSMPVMGGLEASKAIFEMLKECPEVITNIVVLSAFTNQEMVDNCK